MKHVVLTNSSLRGIQYGMLRDFEDEIVRLTGAEPVEAPKRSLPKFLSQRLEHGTRYGGLRRFVPKEEHELKADVLWVVLMGPENFTLDLYKGWDRHVGLKILYLFDTLDAHLTCIRRVLSSTNWDFTSTAFHGARPFLENQTQRDWHVVRHAVKLERFQPAPVENRLIDFCAYGRRLEKAHRAVKDYCSKNGKYYDYTTASAIQHQLDSREHYAQYAWHLSHSIFNFCWPVEVTHPGLIKDHSPITCRWFEAAASGDVILGRAPDEPHFEEIFGSQAVIPLAYENGSEGIFSALDQLWQNRSQHLQDAFERREKHAHQWSWESRVHEIMSILNIN
ncbi:MAG TPA: hypothetical protein VGB17_06580 [Pyrinomonadaceae bacterium]|jgi:hypothetical protein